ncbi:hypothetical protein [Spiroplasma endosymbiont of Dasysyrphus albostriatus]|uniref:hypothetical protein n=1 Tax=Spiroplasma endosymbiont of Dasysyrphus albostriatus TaxID=3066299 RepID=UPI0030D4DF31
MKETIEKINNELKEFWNKNQKKHPDICKNLELSGIVVIKGGVPMIGGALFGALIGVPGGPIGILLVFKGALLQFKPSIDEKYNQIKKTKKLEKLLKRLESIVEEVNLQEENTITIESDSELREENLSDILRKHKLYNEECRKKFFEDDQSFQSETKLQEWGKNIGEEVNKLHSVTSLGQQDVTNNYQTSKM